MTSIVDNLHDAAGSMPHRLGKQANEAQRNAWLLQLEQAWMTNFGTHRSAAEPGSADAGTDAAKDMAASMDAPSAAQERQTFSAKTPVHAAISASLRQDEPSSGDHTVSISDAQMQERASTQRTSPDSSRVTAPTQEMHNGESMAAHVSEAGKFSPAAGSVAIEDATSFSPFKAAMPTGEVALPLLVPMMGTTAPADNAGPGNTLQIAAAQPIKSNSAASWAAFANMQPEPIGETQADTAEQEDVPHAERNATKEAAPSQDQYTARNLHLYRNGNTVQAWLRDAELSDSSAHSVAQALQSELQRSALQLTAVTVNGKPLPFPSAQEEKEGGDGLRTATQEPSARPKTKAAQPIAQTATNNGGATYGD